MKLFTGLQAGVAVEKSVSIEVKAPGSGLPGAEENTKETLQRCPHQTRASDRSKRSEGLHSTPGVVLNEQSQGEHPSSPGFWVC